MSSKAILLALLGVALAVGVPFALDGTAFVSTLRKVAPGLLLSLAALALVSGVARAAKLHLLRRRLGETPRFSRTLAVSLASDFAFLTSPGGVGGYVVNIALLRRGGTSWSTATSAVAGEQALDLVFFALCIPLCALLAAAPLAQLAVDIPGSVYAAVAFVTATFVLAWCGRRRIAALAGSVGPWSRWPQKIGRFAADMRAHLSAIAHGDRRENAGLLLLTCVQWVARYGALWLVLDALGERLSFAFVMLLQAAILHLAQWTAIPAGGGGADIALAAVLSRWLGAPAIAIALPLWRLATLYVPLALGALGFAVLARSANQRD